MTHLPLAMSPTLLMRHSAPPAHPDVRRGHQRTRQPDSGHRHREHHPRVRGTTRVVIAHRLTTVIDADRIYVVKKGQIVQSGEYHQLLAEPGPFQELVHRQST